MGEAGFAEAARQCHAKAVYAAQGISSLPGFSLVFGGEFFNEFVTHCPAPEKTLRLLEEHGILGGYPLPGNRILWCVTEVNTKEEIDELIAILRDLRVPGEVSSRNAPAHGCT
jgi:glycine dehydrogenase subunit 1